MEEGERMAHEVHFFERPSRKPCPLGRLILQDGAAPPLLAAVQDGKRHVVAGKLTPRIQSHPVAEGTSDAGWTSSHLSGGRSWEAWRRG